jgi:hypothetical protein
MVDTPIFSGTRKVINRRIVVQAKAQTHIPKITKAKRIGVWLKWHSIRLANVRP